MNFLKLASTSLVIGLLLAGCSSSGNEKMRHESSESIQTKIIDNVTTKEQVQQLFGSPNSTNFTDSGLEIWKYTFSRTTAKGENFIPVVNWFSQGSNVTTKELNILFDNNNIVKKHTFIDTKDEKNVGIGG